MATQQRNLRVLVVDDNDDHATSLTKLLQAFGYESWACLHSKDCMALVERLRPHVMLLDLTMPGMTGFDIASEIGRNPDLRPARLVAVTGHGHDSDREQTRKFGFDDHLLKPVEPDELRRILHTARRIDELGALDDAEIRLRAYAKWEAAGRPPARSEEDGLIFWYAAQRELIEERLQADAASSSNRTAPPSRKPAT